MRLGLEVCVIPVRTAGVGVALIVLVGCGPLAGPVVAAAVPYLVADPPRKQSEAIALRG